jgi:predicted transcriptional regulator
MSERQLALFASSKRGERRSSYARVRAAITRYQPTSRDAWMSVLAHLPQVDASICQVVVEYGGATCDEIEARTGLKHQTASAQVRHLVEAGVLQPSESRRPTQSGRAAIVWVMAA